MVSTRAKRRNVKAAGVDVFSSSPPTKRIHVRSGRPARVMKVDMSEDVGDDTSEHMSSSENDEESVEENFAPSRSSKHKSQTPSRGKPLAKSRWNSAVLPAKEVKVTPTNVKPLHKPKMAEIPSDRVVPAWESLPFEILVVVFQSAATPLLDGSLRITSSSRWLCEAARTCRAFAEPALSALYEQPPLDNPLAAIRLLDLLKLQPAPNDASPLLFNYRAKIKRIDIDVSNVLMNVVTGRGHFSLAEMIPLLPKLTEITLQHQLYRPPFRIEGHVRPREWHLNLEILDTIAFSHVKLNSWVWSANMLTADVPGAFTPHMPVHKTFWCANLKHLTFAGFEFEGPAASSTQHPPHRAIKNPKLKARFADIFEPLHQLRSLEFISCQSSSWAVLSHVPQNLTSLVITNSNIISSTVEEYLQGFGRSLETLILYYNDHLSLNFLPTLGIDCPSLKTFHVDLTYYNRLSVQMTSAEPAYKALLDDGLIPTWPKSLEDVSLLQLRKWSTSAALNFLNSLVDSADDLPDLRHLEIHAMLPEASWRERARLREEWTEQLKTVFLRKSAPPNPHLASYKAHMLWKADQDGLDDAPPTKRARSIKLNMSKPRAAKSPEASSKDSDVRTTRGRARTEEKSRTEEEPRVNRKQVIHGMCDTVEVTIDNLRPTENQFTEGDFLDSEAEGDDDWNEEVGDPAEDTRTVSLGRRRWRPSRY